MSVEAKTLIPSKYAADSASGEYTVPAGKRTIIDKFTATNTDSGAVTVTVHLVPDGGSTGNSNMIIKAKSVAAGATEDLTALQNQILSAGDAIVVLAGSASKMVIRASGREVT